MTLRPSTLLALSLSVLLAGCQPAAEAPDAGAKAEAAPDAAVAADPAPAGTDVASVVHHAPQDPAGFDRKAFAGTFAGTVPCADCPGIDTRLEILADGTFQLRETYQERDASNDTTGTWTVDADGKRLLLDPDTKDAADRLFEIVSGAEVRMLDGDGHPIDSPHNYSLRRG